LQLLIFDLFLEWRMPLVVLQIKNLKLINLKDEGPALKRSL